MSIPHELHAGPFFNDSADDHENAVSFHYVFRTTALENRFKTEDKMNARACDFMDYMEVRFDQSALDVREHLLLDGYEVHTSYGKQFWCHDVNWDSLPNGSHYKFKKHYKIDVENDIFSSLTLDEIQTRVNMNPSSPPVSTSVPRGRVVDLSKESNVSQAARSSSRIIKK